MIKKCWIWILRLLLVLGLVEFFYLPWQKVLPAELLFLYVLLTSDDFVLKRLEHSVFWVELAYLFILPSLIWHYFLQNDAFWVFTLAILWLQILGRLWQLYRGE